MESANLMKIRKYTIIIMRSGEMSFRYRSKTPIKDIHRLKFYHFEDSSNEGYCLIFGEQIEKLKSIYYLAEFTLIINCYVIKTPLYFGCAPTSESEENEVDEDPPIPAFVVAFFTFSK